MTVVVSAPRAALNSCSSSSAVSTSTARHPHRYERLPDFLALARHYDPAGKFRNAYTARYPGR